MDELSGELEKQVDVSKILGYLNLSDGKPDPRWQKLVNQAYTHLADHGDKQPWITLIEFLADRLEEMKAAGSAAFKNDKQARKVLEYLPNFLEAYRAYHSDLLGHASDADLFTPFFIAKVLEHLLIMGLEKGFPKLEDSFLKLCLRQFNDFVGYRPVAILETRPSGEPYPHERFHCVPLYLRGAGVAWGPYQSIITRAMDILSKADQSLLLEAHLDLSCLEELAMDARGYDHSHPANLRPNYFFGEWDPHRFDNQGRYTRFVLRKALLDILKDRTEDPNANAEEMAFEGAGVLAGTMLMAAAVSGRAPGTHEASISLASMIPGIARIRDTFYEHLLSIAPEAHRERLLQEKTLLKQAFGGARHHLNNLLGRKRAAHVQNRFIGLMLANMGYLDASRAQARKIDAASGRMLAEILGLIRLGHLEIDKSLWAQAAQRPLQAFNIMQRAIECGAIADPWNVLGFQGLFPLSGAREDSTRDSRVDELLLVVEQIFLLIARLMSEAAANGDESLVTSLEAEMEAKARWWDRFATYQVSGVRYVRGAEALSSARMVARALLRWHHRGETPADLAFWRDQLSSLKAPRSFAMIIDLLLRQGDQVAAQGLLMSWLSQADRVPLEEGNHSFHALAARWLLATAVHREKLPAKQLESRHAAVRKFFEQLEANSEDYWQVPDLEPLEESEAEEEEDPFESAYDEMTYQDTTGNDDEGAVSEGPKFAPLELEDEAQDLERRLHFLASSSKLWQIASYYLGSRTELNDEDRKALALWMDEAAVRLSRLRELADNLYSEVIPEPGSDPESMMEYERQLGVRDDLVMETISAIVETAIALGSMHGVTNTPLHPDAFPWEAAFQRVEKALLRMDAEAAREALDGFRAEFSKENLIYVPLSQGGNPRAISRVRMAQNAIDFILVNLPRLGLIRETLELVHLARNLEVTKSLEGRGISEFNRHFHLAFRSVIETVIETAVDDPDDVVIDQLEKVCSAFEKPWIEHSWTGQISTAEGMIHQEAFSEVREFIQNYGKDIFHARFMTLANLRGVLHLGVEHYLEELTRNPDPLHPVKLAEDLGEKITMKDASRLLAGIIMTVSENYQEFKDYNTTCTFSDYGNMLHVFLSFLRVKAIYERKAWLLKPRMLAHEMLARMKRSKAARKWADHILQLTREDAGGCLNLLEQVEKETGVKITSVRDRIESGFVGNLAADRLCALVEPAMGEAKKKGVPKAFRSFIEELEAIGAKPVGVGRDIPEWLIRLENEVQRVQVSHSAIAQLAEGLYKVSRRVLTVEQVSEQVNSLNEKSDSKES